MEIKEPSKAEILAISMEVVSLKARVEINIDMVKPIPPKTETAAI